MKLSRRMMRQLAEAEVTPEMAAAGASALFPEIGGDFDLSEAAELRVMTRVFRAMVMGRDPRGLSPSDLLELLDSIQAQRDRERSQAR